MDRGVAGNPRRPRPTVPPAVVGAVDHIPGVICGHLALPETRSGECGGHGLAIAGLIIGRVQLGGWTLFWVFMPFGSVLSRL